MVKSLNFIQARDMILAAANAVISAKPYLTEVDSAIGDGDHGIGMEVGCRRIIEELGGREEYADMAEIFREAGKAMIFSMGGASGVIFGSMFQGGSNAGKDKTELDGELFAEIMGGSLAAIQRKGKANVGDKTMVDALHPAVCAMKQAGNEIARVLSAAAESAAEGVENTKNMVARFGRAVQLGERSLGHQDAGATSVSIIFKAMLDYVNSIA